MESLLETKVRPSVIGNPDLFVISNNTIIGRYGSFGTNILILGPKGQLTLPFMNCWKVAELAHLGHNPQVTYPNSKFVEYVIDGHTHRVHHWHTDEADRTWHGC